MFIIYDTAHNPLKTPFDMSRVNPNKQYIKHFQNKLAITKVAKTTASREFRLRAEQELLIAERKMKFWEKRHGFEAEETLKACIEIVRAWKANGKNK